ncbi:MAG: bifunctional glutamate N-acetyltransferase/amino-acid acetyltransferase ArgJ [Oscillospiraceae bacterium]|nr:bifunctional glutamate N-acetyltransferase/amino-acid acetyltransferase ArgJ [Oscillospiraceae bacterium]
MLKFIDGGVCAPTGFKAAGVHCGIRKGKTKKDLALIVSDVPANAAAVYTQNLVKAAPIYVTQQNLQNGKATAVVCNSGNANTCNADGMEKAFAMCELTASALNISASDVLVASTGVIGQPLDLEPIRAGIPALVSELSTSGGASAAEAIMTTDTFAKEVAVEIEIDGTPVKIGGIAKGSGMINPNMATMLGFLTTDAKAESDVLASILKNAADISFNRVSVDGDTSTNDTLTIMANGKSGVKISPKTAAYEQFEEALKGVCVALAKMLAKDGEGATKLIECVVSGAPDVKSAELVADSVINSPLVKTAMFGNDANWGRILCAIGYAGARLDVNSIDVAIKSVAGSVLVCQNGAGVAFSEEDALSILQCDEVIIDIALNQGDYGATAWGCDLSYDYVKINGDYRT